MAVLGRLGSRMWYVQFAACSSQAVNRGFGKGSTELIRGGLDRSQMMAQQLTERSRRVYSRIPDKPKIQYEKVVQLRSRFETRAEPFCGIFIIDPMVGRGLDFVGKWIGPPSHRDKKDLHTCDFE